MSKGAREASARDRIAAQRAAERKRDRRKRLVTISVVGVVAVAAIGFGSWYAATQDTAEQPALALPPATVNGDGTVTLAKAGVTAPVLDVYEDFQCPACKALEDSSGSTIKNLAAEGKAKVVYHPLTIFRQEPTRSNSLRAGAAARCIADGKHWMAFHDKLFANQPSETVEGFALNDLVAWGEESGVTDSAFPTCVTSQKHAQAQADQSVEVLRKQNIGGTPELKLDGVALPNETAFVPAKLREAVTAAGK
ncbi:membrane protein [Acrocarpospora phusangensis]|uniref:Membrane protein n=1 Tax=Acrocarpospora phusangensis TaxID=1070424 RepID=A0A919QH40_9ACTN|nr:thioredoxin domain-containing protein [Acrocarpospora phusangensis]GIH26365.1 membrane protein [Acrocarpospora phusangensis]